MAELGLGGLHFHDLHLGSILYAREHQNGQPVRPGQRFWGVLVVRRLICHRDAGQRFEEINPVDSELANDRTFLAWLRTGIACFGLGFVVAKAALIINAGGTSVPYRGWYSLTGVLIVLAGVALVVAGLWQHRHVLRTLRPDVAKPLPQWPATMTTVAVVAGVALSALLTISA